MPYAHDVQPDVTWHSSWQAEYVEPDGSVMGWLGRSAPGYKRIRGGYN